MRYYENEDAGDLNESARAGYAEAESEAEDVELVPATLRLDHERMFSTCNATGIAVTVGAWVVETTDFHGNEVDIPVASEFVSRHVAVAAAKKQGYSV